MSRRVQLVLVCFTLVLTMPLMAQTHVSLPLGDPVYHILEVAELRGLCDPLPKAKPYSRSVAISAAEKILSSRSSLRFGGLSDKEYQLLEKFLEPYGKADAGFDRWKGTYRFENAAEGKIHLSAEMGAKNETSVSGAYYFQQDEAVFGEEWWFTPYVVGDLGNFFSWGFILNGGILYSPREQVGIFQTYHSEFGEGHDNYINREMIAYSQPLAHFPYSYQKRWDGFVWNYRDISNSGQLGWPEGLCIGYSMLPEIGGSLFDGIFTMRGGRMFREWGAMSEGSSLILNQSAQPFLGLEATVSPFKWLGFSTITGILEYYDEAGIIDSPSTNQNAFSLSMVEINYKNYFHFDFGSAAVWPKRFELGYIFPLTSNFFYQNNIGDFDNMSLFFDIKGQYPGLANLWLSFYLDEINPELDIFEMDRSMFAFQVGSTAQIPLLPFASITLSYTKVEPYCYTHTRQILPWYGENLMEQAYTNNGEGLGYYLPPNSDEILVRFKTLLSAYTTAHFQYQMIRHGAEYGSAAVDGSSYLSELDPSGRSTKAILRKDFLHDGAYQWMHIIKAGAEHSISSDDGKRTPLQVFFEAGVVLSYFTKGNGNSLSIIDTDEYPKSNGLLLTVGFKIYP
ncbi:hypothetical protein TREPR_2406 [Treponema primitia ZAS-2]|uniref:Capsule assembly Wzi family protein n=1 Tax=Treponema primitia (strain ATCC BAA-887 / DSM 12427 / ZAS-2) TaxID=545694 RepID=F5YHH3_TREPZ|nr:hypothetical protein [Treponema primitia]AEF85357.1 hypothetical protein TREPR_2406 [Treponema primitia ZAS-2]